ncbi:Deoxyhypusine hydroxylase [Pisolithus sp. B1]|nr:Deoxyhypusine hydroxylase [Pisolithus sp. B1]
MANTVGTTELKALQDSLLNTSGTTTLHDRFRALFTLKSLKSDDAVAIISKGFQDRSALLKHELAYCLGQIKRTSALPVLESVLRNEDEDPMVRHEAAEAIGAISSTSSIPILKEYLTDRNRSVRETCEIALAKIEWDDSEEGKRHIVEKQTTDAIPCYTSVDPAPPSSKLLSGAPRSEDLDDATIHTLRNALAAGFSDDSALFKHEIAFVFGQLLSPHAVPALLKVLEDTSESDMVRHEAAEALGGIATPEVLPHLKEWMTREDAPTVVRESCQVAIDMWEYENSDQFQYANGLEVVESTTKCIPLL